jgi:catechol 2,3-dioxygenase-like lactoylglutathione lyase family enzyme
MLSNSPVNPVLPCRDLKAAREFYGRKLGLKLLSGSEKDGYIMFAAGKGTGFTCFESDSAKSDDTAAGFEVADLEKEMASLRRKGVDFQDYDLPGLKTVNGIATQGDHRVAWIKDPGGNVIALHSGEMPGARRPSRSATRKSKPRSRKALARV